MASRLQSKVAYVQVPSWVCNQGIVDDNVSDDDEPPDLPTAVLVSNRTNPHATFVHYDQVKTVKQSHIKKQVTFNHDQDTKDLFRFFESSPSNNDNQQLQCESNSKLSTHSCVPTAEDIEKVKFVNTPQQ